MKFLVTGGAGQIAKALNNDLPIKDHTVISLSKTDLDISNEKQVKNVLRSNSFDIIINCAAITSVDEAEENPEIAEEANAKALQYLGYYGRKNSIPVLHLSSNYVFDGEKSTPYLETDIPNPLSIYGKTKLKGEEILFEEAKNSSLILRLNWVFSEYEGCNFLLKVLKNFKLLETVKVVDDQIGCPTSAHHVSRIIELLSYKMIAGSGMGNIYHYCDKYEETWCSYAKFILIQAQKIGLISPNARCISTSSSEYKNAAKRPAYGELDSTKICTFLGIQQLEWKDSILLALQKIHSLSLLNVS